MSEESVKTIVVLDVEVNGIPYLQFNKCAITEICIFAFSSNYLNRNNDHLNSFHSKLPELPRVLHKLKLMVYPQSRISSNDLTNEMLCNEAPFDKNAADCLLSFLDRLEKPICLVAHNGFRHDFPILRHIYEKIEMTFPPSIYIVDSFLAFIEICDKVWKQKQLVEADDTQIIKNNNSTEENSYINCPQIKETISTSDYFEDASHINCQQINEKKINYEKRKFDDTTSLPSTSKRHRLQDNSNSSEKNDQINCPQLKETTCTNDDFEDVSDINWHHINDTTPQEKTNYEKCDNISKRHQLHDNSNNSENKFHKNCPQLNQTTCTNEDFEDDSDINWHQINETTTQEKINYGKCDDRTFSSSPSSPSTSKHHSLQDNSISSEKNYHINCPQLKETTCTNDDFEEDSDINWHHIHETTPQEKMRYEKCDERTFSCSSSSPSTSKSHQIQDNSINSENNSHIHCPHLNETTCTNEDFEDDSDINWHQINETTPQEKINCGKCDDKTFSSSSSSPSTSKRHQLQDNSNNTEKNSHINCPKQETTCTNDDSDIKWHQINQTRPQEKINFEKCDDRIFSHSSSSPSTSKGLQLQDNSNDSENKFHKNCPQLNQTSCTNGDFKDDSDINWQQINETTPQKKIGCEERKFEDTTFSCSPSCLSTSKRQRRLSLNTRRVLFHEDFSPNLPQKEIFKLGIFYKNILGHEPENIHQAEFDVLYLTQLILYFGLTFQAYMEERKRKFKDVPILGSNECEEFPRKLFKSEFQ